MVWWGLGRWLLVITQSKQSTYTLVRTSKTHGLGDKPQKIKITSTELSNITTTKNTSKRHRNILCPFKIIREFLAVRPMCISILNKPLFVFSDRKSVTPVHAWEMLLKLIQELGLNSTAYSFHGLRRGRATDLWEWGVPVSTIQKLGRWKSNAVYTYLR